MEMKRIDWFKIAIHAINVSLWVGAIWLTICLCSGCSLTVHDSTDVTVIVVDSTVSPEVTGVEGAGL